MAWFTFEPRWEPFREMEQLRRDMDRLWDQTFFPGRVRTRAGVFPPVNISQDNDHIYVRTELAGLQAQDLEITFQDNSLILKGERKIPTEEKVIGYHRREREAGTFRRLIRLPERIDPAKVEAAFKDGVLTITLAKPEETKPKQIQIKSA